MIVRRLARTFKVLLVLWILPAPAQAEGWFSRAVPLPLAAVDQLESIHFNDAGEILTQWSTGQARPVYWWKPDSTGWEQFQPRNLGQHFTATDFKVGLVAGTVWTDPAGDSQFGSFLWRSGSATVIRDVPAGFGPVSYRFVNNLANLAGPAISTTVVTQVNEFGTISFKHPYAIFTRTPSGPALQVGPNFPDEATVAVWNDRGHFAGNRNPSGGAEIFYNGMYFWNGGAMVSIQDSDRGIDGFGPTDLNNRDEIVGTYGGGRPFLWSVDRGFVDLRNSEGFFIPRINDGTQILAGDWFRKDGEWKTTAQILDGVFTVPAGRVAQFIDINNAGQLLCIVGTPRPGAYPKPDLFLVLDPARDPLQLALEPDRLIRKGETFAVRITVRHSGEAPAEYRFPEGLLTTASTHILTVGVTDVPESFTLSPDNPERIFRVPVAAEGRGVAVLESSVLRSVAGQPEVTHAASLDAIVTPFEINVAIVPRELRLNQTPESELGPRSRALNAELAAAGQPKKINAVEIELTVTNAGNVPVDHVNLPGALALSSLIRSKELDNPGVPLIPLRFYPPVGAPIDLANPTNASVEDVVLAPGETAVFAWIADAYDQNPDPEADDSADLAFQSLVLGSIEGRNVQDLGNGDFSIVDQPLLAWGIRPNAGRTRYLSGQAVRVDGYLENISARNGREGRDLVVMMCQTHQGNVGGGFFFDAQKLGQRTPRYYELFELPAEGPGKSLDLAAIFHTLPTVEASSAKIACEVRIWAKDDQDRLISADSQKVLQEGWNRDVEVALNANPPLFSLRQECENQLGISPFLCGLNEGLVLDATDAAMGLTQFLLEGGKQLAHAGSAIFSHEIWAHTQLWKAVLGNDAARNSLLQEIYVQYLTFAELGLMAEQAGARFPMAFEEFSVQSVGALDNFFRAVDTGNLSEVQYQVGKFLGANPDLVFEPLVVARCIERQALALEGKILEDTLAAAGKATSKNQAETLERRILAAEADPNVSNLATALEPGDALSLSHLRRIFGVGKEQLQLLQKIARDNGIIITFRSRSPLSYSLIKDKIAWPKPRELKFKTINDIDVQYLGYRPTRKARIDVIEPPDSLLGKTGADLDAAIDVYMEQLRSLHPKLDQNSVLLAEVEERLRGRLAEWDKLTAKLRLRETPDPSDIEIPVNFGVGDQLTPGWIRDYLPDLGATSTRTVRSRRAVAADVLDPVTGKTRRTWEISMSGPDGSDFRDVTGDIDFLAILEPGGGFIRNPLRRRRIYAQLAAALDMQHGESFAFFQQQAREEYLRCCTLGGEAMVAIAPFGDQTPRAAYFVEHLSVMENGSNPRFLPPRQILRDEGGKVLLKDGVPLEARRPNPTGEFVLIAGADVNSKINLNFANIFFPTVLSRTIERFLSLRPFLVPALLARLVGRQDDGAQISREPGVPVLQAVGNTEGGPLVFRVWEEGAGWRVVDVTEAVGLGGPGVLDMAPMSAMPVGAPRGAAQLEVLAPQNPGSPSHPSLFSVKLHTADFTAAAASPGSLFERGDRVVLNPGEPNEEFATLRNSDPLTLSRPLRHDHQAGEMIVSLGPDLADRDGDGLSLSDELASGTDPNHPDTDRDGFSDTDEIARGTDPLDPASSGAEIVSLTLTPQATDIFLLFRGAVGRSYRLEASRTLESAWQDLGQFAATGDLDLFSAPLPFPNAKEVFFRFRLIDPDDPDDDGLTDLDEAILGSHPLLPDTDGDGMSDGQETALGLDPLNAFSALRITSFAPQTGTGTLLEFSSLPGRSYAIESSAGPDLTDWKAAAVVTATDTTTALILPTSAENPQGAAFRVRWIP